MATQAGIAYVTIAYDPAAVEKLRAETRAQGQAIASSWSQSSKKIGQSLSSAGRTLTRNLTLPLVGAGYAATKYAYGFEQSLNHIQALVGANTKQMDYYKKSILALSPAVAQGPTQLADALYFITSSGFKGAKALDVLKASAMGAASGLGDTKTIADLVTSAINVYGQKNLTASRAVDDLTQAVKDGKGEPADYAAALGRVIPVAQNLGVSFDQVSAALASLTLGGFSADKATTGLQSIFQNLSKPTATGAAELKKVGLSYAGIRNEITTKGLLPALLDMNKAFDGNGVALRKVFSSGKAIVSFLSLTGQAAQKNVGIFNDLTNSAGASAKAFATQSQTTAFQMQKALAQIQVAAVQVGGIVLPVFAELATKVAGLATKFGELPQGFQEIAIGAAVGAAALGPLLSVVGNVTLALGKLRIAAVGASGQGGLLALAKANPEIAMVALGVAVTALAIHFLNARDASNAVTAAFKQQTAAIDDLVSATLAAKNDHLAFKQAQLDVRTTTVAVTEAQRAENKAVKAYGFGSSQARQAMLQLTQARLDHQSAILRENAAGAKWRTEVHKQTGEIHTLKNGINAARDAVKNQLQDFQRSGSVKGLSDYTKGLKSAADKLDALAAEARQKGLPAIAALATKMANQNRAALTLAESSGVLIGKMSTLAQRIRALPNRKDIYIYTHFQSLGNVGNPGASGGDHRNSIKPHTGGIITQHGLHLAGGGIAYGGVYGRDSVPAMLTPGEMVLNSSQQSKLFDLLEHGTGGTPEVNVYVGNESVDARVQFALKKTSRRLQAGQKWSLA